MIITITLNGAMNLVRSVIYVIVISLSTLNTRAYRECIHSRQWYN